MTRAKRIALEVLGPPLLGSLLINSAWVLQRFWVHFQSGRMPDWDPSIFAWMGLIALIAYVVAGLPSVLHAIIMENSFANGLDPRSWWTVLLSSASGAFAGTAIGFWLGRASGDRIVAIFVGLGLVVGFLLGCWTKRCSAKTIPNPQASETMADTVPGPRP